MGVLNRVGKAKLETMIKKVILLEVIFDSVEVGKSSQEKGEPPKRRLRADLGEHT